MNNGTQYSGTYSSTSVADASSNLTDAVVDTMVRWPMRMTGAAVDLMIRGAQSMTGSGRSSTSNGYSSSSSYDSTRSSAPSSSGSKSGWSTFFNSQTSGTFDQDLSGDDLKYVIWSIVFSKPGYECILQKQQEELVNYSADSSTYAAVKIAKFLDSARHGHSDRPEGWGDKGYPADSSKPKSSGPSENRASSSEQEKGWRIPPEDQKYICFLYRVDRRIPRQEEVTRVERVTVERNTRIV
jgi:hypothetical protein